MINEQLQIQLQQLSHNSQITVGVSRRQLVQRPSTCPSCGCDVIWRNGTYARKDDKVMVCSFLLGCIFALNNMS
ncbi:hypothetical protein Desgi_0532 [Desulfoscipio gibsoniae DSM 7213]|uniref:Uncharacterized protein n=1 Tax=Desulfoscipio gibsoniae DSM 7213 TaxID=767817 RepID=R4KC12_9FIRM|nr:hypothetical protein Desgi_0532 [Desulfoscipio gibsoniae DSM 7213]